MFKPLSVGKEQTVARLQQVGNVISSCKVLVENDSKNTKTAVHA